MQTFYDKEKKKKYSYTAIKLQTRHIDDVCIRVSEIE